MQQKTLEVEKNKKEKSPSTESSVCVCVCVGMSQETLGKALLSYTIAFISQSGLVFPNIMCTSTFRENSKEDSEHVCVNFVWFRMKDRIPPFAQNVYLTYLHVITDYVRP